MKVITQWHLRLVGTAMLATALAFATMPATAAPTNNESNAELRIKAMHKQLQLTPAQQGQWDKVALTMMDNAKVMDALSQVRADHAKDMTAVEDLKSFGDIANAYAEGIKNLSPVFADLYASMSDAQKKTADDFFRHDKAKPSGKKSTSK